MNKILLVFAIVFGQTVMAQVTLKGNRLRKDGVSYKFSQYQKVFTNAEAQAYFRKARTNKTVGEIISGIGGFGLGYGLASALHKREYVTNYWGSPKVSETKGTGWGYVAIGGAFILGSIPFYIGTQNNVKKALAIENDENPEKATTFRPHFLLESTGTTVALSYHF